MKNFFAKLVGFREVARGQKPFHQREKIEQELAEERKIEAKENMQERLRDEMKRRDEPSEVDILGPSDSESKEA